MHTLDIIKGFTVAFAIAGASAAHAAEDKPIRLPDDKAYTESIAVAPDGRLYASSLALGGIKRIDPKTGNVESFIAPGAANTRSTFGVYVDASTNVLWACSNDVSAMGIPGPGTAKGSRAVSFDLGSGMATGEYPLPGDATLCNDITSGPDGAIYITNSLTPEILRLPAGAKSLEVFVHDKQFQPPKGAGLDGIAFGDDGNLYVNTFDGGDFFRVAIKDGKPGAVSKLTTSQPLKNPDALRHVTGQTFLMAEGSGKLDRVTVEGDTVKIETLKDGLKGPTALARIGDTVWVGEGQLSHLFDPKSGPPTLPFEIVPVQIGLSQ
jgi:streptogramin lyase